jgi:alpha-ketoglutarate-dependent 2,4-dichlorophenoxyacetate dioxygenase
MYIANHAHSIVDMPLEEGQAEIRRLLDHATQEKYVCPVSWDNVGDLGEC